MSTPIYRAVMVPILLFDLYLFLKVSSRVSSCASPLLDYGSYGPIPIQSITSCPRAINTGTPMNESERPPRRWLFKLRRKISMTAPPARPQTPASVIQLAGRLAGRYIHIWVKYIKSLKSSQMSNVKIF